MRKMIFVKAVQSLPAYNFHKYRFHSAKCREMEENMRIHNKYVIAIVVVLVVIIALVIKFLT